MKKFSYIITGLMLLFFCSSSINAAVASPDELPSSQSQETSLRVVSSPELMRLTTNWVNEYKKLQPDAGIQVSELPASDFTLSDQLVFVTGESRKSITGQTGFEMAVGRDAIVPVINARNPFMAQIRELGLTADKLAQLFSVNASQNWEIVSNELKSPMKVSLIENSEIMEQVAKFSRVDASEISASLVSTPQELILAVQKDVYALGFCRFADILEMESSTFAENIAILPIDKNRNGRIDYFENIYDTPEAFVRGIWTGKYPSALTENIYIVSATQPTGENAMAFLAWLNGEGQEVLNLYGYSLLSSMEKASNLSALEAQMAFTGEMEAPVRTAGWLKVLIAMIAVTLLVSGIVIYQRNRKTVMMADSFKMSPALTTESIKAPGGLYFDKTHTWAFMEKDGRVRIGIDDFLQHLTGPLTRIKMKEPGEKVRKGEKIITLIREGKQLEIYAPVSGTIMQQNQALLTNSTMVNSSPYADGWIYTIEPVSWAREIQFMFMGSEYKEWLTEEFSRLRDFFASSVQSNEMVYEHVVLQDGGEITDNVLSELGPEVWEDFQTKFIDTSR
jgi:glycine cleavage system H lipoate-binding protein/ABC-type phosphate transport system substrate-binding protein